MATRGWATLPENRHNGVVQKNNQDNMEEGDDKSLQPCYHFEEDTVPENLLELTTSYWRRLRFAKPLTLTYNVDKAVECRLKDTLLAASVKVQPKVDDKTPQREKTEEISACYINMNAADEEMEKIVDSVLSAEEPFDAIMVDINLTGDMQSTNVARMDEMSSSIAVSKHRKYTIFETDMYPVLIDARENEGAVFSELPRIFRKVNGFDVVTGALIAAMISVSPGNPMLASITAVLGIEYSAKKCADISEGPGSLVSSYTQTAQYTQAVNFTDKMHTISVSPDNLLQHNITLKLYKQIDGLLSEDEFEEGMQSDLDCVIDSP
ncbi:uncharacterized protein BXIN_2857 [Babesia sp. Xinjiang]|uniref:uncharacterized protein n=1 Tax=Babesia sp. Xinjiang TaxID=462227 RepID=UPI000A24C764|nr:uncharacterized protein BXIN_2857 [Babesia sp. Xinjiang]ORM39549.1 hypothetical protein BXIN_2857 [Babesia sp. Xinjiang]